MWSRTRFLETLSVLPAGQSTGSHGHAHSNLLVAVHEGAPQVMSEAGPAIRLTMKPGEFDWHSGLLSHTITNVGTTQFDAIEVVRK